MQKLSNLQACKYVEFTVDAQFILVEPHDTIDDLEASSGCPIITSWFSDAIYPHEDFAPSFEFIEKLLNAFPNVLSDWLILGKTPEKSMNKKEESEPVKEVIQQIDTNKKVVKIMVFYDDFSIDTFNKEVN